MWAEILLLSAAGATAAYVVDPQFKSAVNTAIASVTGAPSTSTSAQQQQQSASNNASNIGAGWQQIMADLSQLFANQRQLQQEYGTSPSQQPALNITYPSNTGSSSNSSNTDAILSYLEQEQAAALAQQQAYEQQQAAEAAAQQQAAQQAYEQQQAAAQTAAQQNYEVQNAGGSSGNPGSGSIFNSQGGLATSNPAVYGSPTTSGSSSGGSSGFSVSAAEAAGYTVTPSSSAPGGYVLSSGGQQLNIYGNPISSSSTPVTSSSSTPVTHSSLPPGYVTW